MKNLKIKPGTFTIDELAEKVRRHFHTRYLITSNNINQITIARNKNIGCKLILTKKRLMIHGTFPTTGRSVLALCILIFGAVVIPMAIYLFAFKGKFEAIEKEVDVYISTEFADRLVK